MGLCSAGLIIRRIFTSKFFFVLGGGGGGGDICICDLGGGAYLQEGLFLEGLPIYKRNDPF